MPKQKKYLTPKERLEFVARMKRVRIHSISELWELANTGKSRDLFYKKFGGKEPITEFDLHQINKVITSFE